MMLVDPFRFAGSNPAELEFLSAQNYPKSLGETTWSLGDIDIGEPRADRRIFLVLHLYRRQGLSPVVGGTINGNPIIIHGQAKNVAYPDASPPVEYLQCTILSALVPTGSSGNIEIEFSPPAQGFPYMAVYRATNIQSDIARDAKSIVSNDAFHTTASLDVAKGGFVIAGAGFFGVNTSSVYIDGVVDHYVSNPGSSLYRHFGGSGLMSADDPAYPLDCVVVRESAPSGVFVAASFR